MAIKRDEQQVSIQPSGRMVREFRTDLPGPSGMAKAQELGAEVSRIGALFGEAEAREVATEKAASIEIPKDENNNFYRPETPEGFGIFARNIYNRVVNDRVAYASVQAFEAYAQTVRAENTNDPIRARELLEADARARIEALDPQVRLRAEPLINREVNQQMGSILMEDARTRLRLEVESSQDYIRNHVNEATDLFTLGDPEAIERGNQALRLARINVERLVALRARPESDLVNFDNEARAIRYGANVMQVINSRLSDGTLSVDRLVDLSRMVRSPFTDGENNMGITPEDIRELVRSPQARDALATRIDRMASSLTRQQALNEQNNRHAAVMTAAQNGQSGPPVGMNTRDFDVNHVARWATENNVNIYTPSGLDRAYRTFQHVPTTLLNNYFRSVGSLAPQQIEEKRVLFQHLSSMPVGSGELSHARGAMSPNDFNFMFHYNAQRDSNIPAELALRNTQTLFSSERAGDTREGSIVENISRLRSSRESRTSATTIANLNQDMDNYFPRLGGTAGLFGARADWSQATDRQRLNIINTTNILMSNNPLLKYDDALKQAVDGFVLQHIYDPNLTAPSGRQGAVVPRSQALPTARNIREPIGNGTTDYVPLYIRAVFDADRNLNPPAPSGPTVSPAEADLRQRRANERGRLQGEPALEAPTPAPARSDDDRLIPRQQPYGRLPDDLKFGENVFLVHTGDNVANPGYFLMTQKDGNMLPVYDYTRRPVVMNFGVAAQTQNNFVDGVLLNQATAEREARRAAEAEGTRDTIFPAAESLVPNLGMPEPGAARVRIPLPPDAFGPIRVEDVIVRRDQMAPRANPVTAPSRGNRGGAGSTRNDYIMPITTPSPVTPENRPIYDRLSEFGKDDVVKANTRYLNSDFASELHKFIDAMPENIRRQVVVTSSVRTPKEQEDLWAKELHQNGGNEQAAARRVARPDSRNVHTEGFAVDIRTRGKPELLRWMQDNVGRFNLHFPVEGENWHLEYKPWDINRRRPQGQRSSSVDTPDADASYFGRAILSHPPLI